MFYYWRTLPQSLRNRVKLAAVSDAVKVLPNGHHEIRVLENKYFIIQGVKRVSISITSDKQKY